jgi:hypothetical protein
MSENVKQGSKIRMNLALDSDLAEKGKQLAAGERRSFNNFIEVLLEKAIRDEKLPPVTETAGCTCSNQ